MERSSETLRQDELVLGLRQLLASLESTVRASTAAGQFPVVEDILANLEARDEHFHSYGFVRRIRSRIDDELGSLIEMELEKQVIEGDGHDIVPVITETLLASQRFARLSETITSAVREAANTMIHDYASDRTKNHEVSVFPSKISLHRSREGGGGGDQLSFQSFDDDSSETSTLNQTGSFLMSPSQFRNISMNLSSSQPSQVRFEALQSLGQYVAGDLLASEQWPELKKSLQETLSDSDIVLSSQSLRIHAKLFNAASGHEAIEIYVSLLDHLQNSFGAMRKPFLEPGTCFDTADEQIEKILKGFRLLNNFLLEIPMYWMRYPIRLTEEIVKSTFNLLSSNLDSKINPFLLLALVDPKLTWFKKWMHPFYGRREITQFLEQNQSLVTFAVGQCLKFFDERQSTAAETDDQQTPEVLESTDSSFIYSSDELDYIEFVSSLHFVGRLVVYASGRASFPIDVDNKRVEVLDFLVASLKAMLICRSHQPLLHIDNSFDPGLLISHALRRIAYGGAVCREQLLNDSFIDVLLGPLRSLLSESQQSSLATDNTLLWIADVVALLATSQRGRMHLLYGQGNPKWSKSSSSPVHILAQFVRRALEGSLPSSSLHPPSENVIGSYVFVCRQLYNTCEGLHVLYPYQLHTAIVVAWREAVSATGSVTQSPIKSPTPTPISSPTPGSATSSYDIGRWEDSLVDNLLNFSATPKGLLLLQQTGTLAHCVSYMYRRYTQKLQVSKCEKFGYGVLVTMVASTAAGMVALCNSGFVSLLVHDLWAVLEGVDADDRMTSARYDPMDSLHRLSHKSLVNLLNVFSAFSAVYEAINFSSVTSTVSSFHTESGGDVDAKNWPSSIFDLIDKLVLVDSAPKMAALLQFEQSHLFGLRFVSVLTTCLDSFLYIESLYSIQDAVLLMQERNTTSSGNFIIDMCSVERNRLLVSTYLIGGPSERILPPRDLTNDPNNPYPWPMFSSFPVPSAYRSKNPTKTMATSSGSLARFLEKTAFTPANASWKKDCQDAFYNLLRTQAGQITSQKVLVTFLDRFIDASIATPGEVFFPIKPESSDFPVEPLSSMQTLGTALVVRYGRYLKVLDENADKSTSALVKLLQRTKGLLRTQQRSIESSLHSLKGDYPGHDWFASTLFLLFNGNGDGTWKFLVKFSQLLPSCYLWAPRLHVSAHLPVNLAASGIHPIFSAVGHNVELILQAEVPRVHSAFRLSGFTPTQMCQHWLYQCFWNYLDWQEICYFVCLCIVAGIDYQIYFCIAIFRHLEYSILQAVQQHNLLTFLKERPIEGFACSHHLDYMQSLEKTYRDVIMPDLADIKNP
ncbi:protein broad-minded-like isoform X2 [Oscarella lobularis]|uniref:protein broad-minded-like isoform X2 n=1 Tax=Oscarella lobularis TaxID=121494 RepID=UPI0033143EE3